MQVDPLPPLDPESAVMSVFDVARDRIRAGSMLDLDQYALMEMTRLYSGLYYDYRQILRELGTRRITEGSCKGTCCDERSLATCREHVPVAEAVTDVVETSPPPLTVAGILLALIAREEPEGGDTAAPPGSPEVD